jgi:fructose-specific component phosphotransferase system IIB-like protein
MKGFEEAVDARRSRRNFLKGAGVLTGSAAVAAVAGLAPAGVARAAQVADTSTVEWEAEADIIVCGGGGGLLAACDAADAGNEVILLEKSSVVGGESCVNEGWINGAGTSVQEAEGVTDDAETQAAEYAMNHAAHINNIDQELLTEYCAESGASIERLIELGCEYVLAQDTMFITSVPRAHLIQPNASAWASVLSAAAEDRGVTILTETPMTSLLRDAEGTIIGVESEGKNYKARKGVILATGDVSANTRMKAKFQPDWAQIDACIPTNTGDGLFHRRIKPRHYTHRAFLHARPHAFSDGAGEFGVGDLGGSCRECTPRDVFRLHEPHLDGRHLFGGVLSARHAAYSNRSPHGAGRRHWAGHYRIVFD